MRLPFCALPLAFVAIVLPILTTSCSSQLGRPLAGVAATAAGIAATALKQSGGDALADGISSATGGALSVVGDAADAATDAVGNIVSGTPAIVSDPLSTISSAFPGAASAEEERRMKIRVANFVMPHDELVKVAVIGDELTAGLGLRSPERDGYPRQLELELGSGWKVKSFAEAGAAVQTDADLPYRNTPGFAAVGGWEPDVLLVMLGKNDTKEWNYRDLDALASGYVSLAEALTVPSEDGSAPPQVWLVAPPSLNADSGSADPSANSLIAEAAQAASEEIPVRVINLDGLLSSQGKLVSTDSGMPTEAGHKVIAEHLAALLDDAERQASE